MFSRLRRPMSGRSSTFRKLGFIPRGCAPHVVRRTRSKQTGNRRASKTVFAKYKRGGHSPIKRNALSEGRRPSAHRAAEPRMLETYADRPLTTRLTVKRDFVHSEIAISEWTKSRKGDLFYAEKTANTRCRHVPALRLPVDFGSCGNAALQSGWLLGRRHRAPGRGAGNRGR